MTSNFKKSRIHCSINIRSFFRVTDMDQVIGKLRIPTIALQVDIADEMQAAFVLPEIESGCVAMAFCAGQILSLKPAILCPVTKPPDDPFSQLAATTG